MTEPTPTVNSPKTRNVGVLLGIGIFLLPLVFSWFTLRKGHSAVARVVSLVWLAVFFILAGREDADEEQKLASISQEPSPRMVASSEPERAPPSEGARAPSDESPRQAPVQAPEPKPAFALNEKEQAILKELMLEDIEGFADGGDSVFGVSRDESTPVVVSADALQREYERNEVAADQKFRHKTIILNGKVGSIDRSIGESYSVSFRGGSNMFMHPRAQMASGYTDYLATLNKGQKIGLLCTGGGLLLGSAIASGCSPVEGWINTTIGAVLEALPNQVRAGDKLPTFMLAAAVYMTPKFSTKSACWSDGQTKACRKELGTRMNQLPKRFERDETLKEAMATRFSVDLEVLAATKK